jgi:serine/threonine protein kinase
MDRERIIKQLAKSRLRPDGDSREYVITRKLGQGGNGVAFLVRTGRRELVAKIYVPPDSRDLDEVALKRFRRETELCARTRHPFVVAAEGAGSVAVGAYTFPFYLMPKAGGTLRGLIPKEFSVIGLGKRLRVFTQVLSGVSYLHHLGIVHRDLKPENVLLFRNNTPMVADLGIAHVAPGFTDWSRLTLPKDHLMNWDYYAPEQRGGDATAVDHRADIYALGLILYEMISGVSPARPNLPALASLHTQLAHIDGIFRKMTAHAPSDRYPSLDVLVDELTWTLIPMGVPVAIPASEESDRKTLIHLLRSRNAERQAQAYEIAQRLGANALPEMHELTGDHRLDIALAAYRLLGQLAHKDSLPYLLAGLYPRRASQKPRFVTGEAAAEALRCYPPKDRLAVLKLAQDLVLEPHVRRIVEGIACDKSYPAVLRLYQSGLIHEEQGGESALSLLLCLNEDRGWELVERRLSSQETLRAFTIFDFIFENVGVERQMALIDYMLAHCEDSASTKLHRILAIVSTGAYPFEFALGRISRLRALATSAFRKVDEWWAFNSALDLAEDKVRIACGEPTRKMIEDEFHRIMEGGIRPSGST